ncbi:MAG: hypothetical protein RLZZ271_1483 [Pseudomonadota bacterium]|jgi:two-component system nitrate/nitrite sensor histidine kinase NarX
MVFYKRLSTKFMVVGVMLLTLALLSIGLTMWITWQIDGGAAAVNEAGRLRMQIWRLSSAVQGGREPAEIHGLLHEFDGTMKVLRQGDPERPLFVPWNDDSQRQFDGLARTWQDMRPMWSNPQPPDAWEMTQRSELFVSQVNQLVLSIEKTLSTLTAVLNLFQFLMLAMAVAAAILSIYVGYLFVIYPIRKLQDGLKRVEAGDFSTRVSSDSPDEFGDLAAGFNHMTQALEVAYHSLELKVQEKTRDLAAERSRLAALYEVSTFLVEPNTLDDLARGFAQKVRKLSNADAVAVRWSDEASQRYLMLASDCLPQELATREHCIEAGQCACGQEQAQAHTRVIPIVPVDHDVMGSCARAGLSCVVSVPIRLQNKVIGEVDLFYRHDVVLTTEDKGLYDALAGHLANAVENLRTEALVREAAVSEERTMLARELHDSIAQSLAFLKIQITLLRQAIHKQDAALAQRVIDEIDAGVRESTGDVRELLVHFRTRTNSDDIEDALRVTLHKFEHQTGLSTQLAVQGHGVSLPSDVQLQVLHVIQEALSNVRKHAQATEVSVSVEREPHWVFRVRDNGCGFEPRAGQPDDTHVGLHIMRERAQRIGAKVNVASTPGTGTEVRIELEAA